MALATRTGLCVPWLVGLLLVSTASAVQYEPLTDLVGSLSQLSVVSSDGGASYAVDEALITGLGRGKPSHQTNAFDLVWHSNGHPFARAVPGLVLP